jgi:1-aminocyclopropane-1-carboxylate deaminase/D-cysteine desulfhydrase-like pyridoxal-dependent ACC family enzyme
MGLFMTCDELRAAINRLPRLPITHRPTPLEAAPRFSQALGGPAVWLKRDDCTGLALGGNKTRHNEFVFGEAVARGADTVVWGAGVQSNNCRQTAAACAKAGLECRLVLSTHGLAGEPVVQGNLLLDLLMGAAVELVPEEIGPALDARMDAVVAKLRAEGRRVFCWTDPAVKPLAAVGYAECLIEAVEQAEAACIAIDAVYVSSAGSTGAGLALAAKALGVKFPVINVCPMDWPWDTRAYIAGIANGAAERLGIGTRLAHEDVILTFDHIAPGYGKVSPGSLEAIRLLGRTEGVLLDPIYSGKAAAGLVADVRAGRFTAGQNAVLIHTGGTPALFAYAEELAAGL